MEPKKTNGRGFQNLVSTTAYVLLVLVIIQFIHHYFFVYTGSVTDVGKNLTDWQIGVIGGVQVVTTVGVVIIVAMMLPRGKKPVDDDGEKDPEPVPTDNGD